jgi:putative salt-induced outer membrane protein
MTQARPIFRTIPVAACLAALASPALAELPPPVRAMVDAAIASGDKAKVDAVISVARETNPGDAAELDALKAGFDAKQKELAQAKAAEQQAKLDHGGVFDNWSGSGQIGLSRATGNSDDIGLSLALALDRKGVRWQHKFKATADFQRSNGTTTREQFLVSYQPRFSLGDNFYAYAIAQWERDRFQGFSSRVSLSGGFGYHLIDRDNMHLSLQAGPAWRRTSFVAGGSDDHLSAMGELDFDWKLARNLNLTQALSTYLDSGTTTITSTTGLEAAINGSLKARFSYEVNYDAGAPPGAVKTDTLSRMTLVYGF